MLRVDLVRVFLGKSESCDDFGVRVLVRASYRCIGREVE